MQSSEFHLLHQLEVALPYAPCQCLLASSDCRFDSVPERAVPSFVKKCSGAIGGSDVPNNISASP